MEKTATLNLRVNPTVKKNAEEVLNRLGMPMSTAINLYLHQIALVGGIPFSVRVPEAPPSIDMTRMTEAELHTKLQKGYEDYKTGRVQDAGEAFGQFREKYGE